MPAEGVKRVACATALAAVLAGCGGTAVGAVEKQVATELGRQLDRQRARQGLEPVTTRVSKVDCPDDADTSAGSMFRCRALDPNGRVVGTVTVQMRDGGKGRWQFLAASPE